MRKKFFAVYALVGALVASPVFTSCIDGEESESVTAVRTQKAEAMRIANQIAAANAELQIQRDKLALEKDIANYEALMANYEAQLLQYQLQIKQNQESLDNFGVVALSTLTNNYTNALSSIASTEWNIVRYNQDIAMLQEGYMNSAAYVAKETARLEALIAAAEIQIEEVKKLQEDGFDKSSMNKKVEELKYAAEKAKKELAELENKYGKAAAKTATGKAIAFLANPDGNASTSDAILVTTTDAEGNPVLLESKVKEARKNFAKAPVTIDGTEVDANIVLPYYKLELGTEADTEKTTYSYEDAPLTKYPTMYAQLAMDNKNMAAANELLAKLEKALADAKAALAANTDETKVTELEGKVTAALGLLNDYKVDAAVESATDYDGNAETKEMGYACAKNAVEVSENKVIKYKENIQALEKAIVLAKKNSEVFEAAIATFDGEDYEAYLAALAELKAAETAKTEATTAHQELKNLYDSYNEGVFLGQNFITVNGEEFYYQMTTAEKITELENKIAGYKKSIAELEASYYYNGVNADSEEMLAVVIAYIEELIAIEEVKLATYEKQAEEAKAALDAYLAE